MKDPTSTLTRRSVIESGITKYRLVTADPINPEMDTAKRSYCRIYDLLMKDCTTVEEYTQAYRNYYRILYSAALRQQRPFDTVAITQLEATSSDYDAIRARLSAKKKLGVPNHTYTDLSYMSSTIIDIISGLYSSFGAADNACLILQVLQLLYISSCPTGRNSPFVLLCGGVGTGKTTVLLSLYRLCAPFMHHMQGSSTGKAHTAKQNFTNMMAVFIDEVGADKGGIGYAGTKEARSLIFQQTQSMQMVSHDSISMDVDETGKYVRNHSRIFKNVAESVIGTSNNVVDPHSPVGGRATLVICSKEKSSLRKQTARAITNIGETVSGDFIDMQHYLMSMQYRLSLVVMSGAEKPADTFGAIVVLDILDQASDYNYLEEIGYTKPYTPRDVEKMINMAIGFMRSRLMVELAAGVHDIYPDDPRAIDTIFEQDEDGNDIPVPGTIEDALLYIRLHSFISVEDMYRAMNSMTAVGTMPDEMRLFLRIIKNNHLTYSYGSIDGDIIDGVFYFKVKPRIEATESPKDKVYRANIDRGDHNVDPFFFKEHTVNYHERIDELVTKRIGKDNHRVIHIEKHTHYIYIHPDIMWAVHSDLEQNYLEFIYDGCETIATVYNQLQSDGMDDDTIKAENGIDIIFENDEMAFIHLTDFGQNKVMDQFKQGIGIINPYFKFEGRSPDLMAMAYTMTIKSRVYSTSILTECIDPDTHEAYLKINIRELMRVIHNPHIELEICSRQHDKIFAKLVDDALVTVVPSLYGVFPRVLRPDPDKTLSRNTSKPSSSRVSFEDIQESEDSQWGELEDKESVPIIISNPRYSQTQDEGDKRTTYTSGHVGVIVLAYVNDEGKTVSGLKQSIDDTCFLHAVHEA